MALRDRASHEGSQRSEPVNLVSVYLERLLAEIDRDGLHGLSEVQRRARLERKLGEILSIDGPVMSDRERTVFIRRVVDEALGLGVLEPLLADSSITEIMVNGPHDVFVERHGRVERHHTAFASTEHLMQTIDRIVSRVNRRVDESSPMVDARLSTGSGSTSSSRPWRSTVRRSRSAGSPAPSGCPSSSSVARSTSSP